MWNGCKELPWAMELRNQLACALDIPRIKIQHDPCCDRLRTSYGKVVFNVRLAVEAPLDAFAAISQSSQQWPFGEAWDGAAHPCNRWFSAGSCFRKLTCMSRQSFVCKVPRQYRVVLLNPAAQGWNRQTLFEKWMLSEFCLCIILYTFQCVIHKYWMLIAAPTLRPRCALLPAALHLHTQAACRRRPVTNEYLLTSDEPFGITLRLQIIVAWLSLLISHLQMTCVEVAETIAMLTGSSEAWCRESLPHVRSSLISSRR